MKNVTLIDSKRNPQTVADLVAQALSLRETIGGNLRSWRERTGIPLDQTETRLGVPAAEFIAWETGSISPRCSRFIENARRLDAIVDAAELTSTLNLQSQLMRKSLAQLLKKREWANTFDALGVAYRSVA